MPKGIAKPKRYRRRRKRFYKKRKRYCTVGKVYKLIKKTSPKETKHMTFQRNNTAISTSGILQDLFIMSAGQGITTNSRIGDQITTSSIIGSYHIAINASATATVVRVMLVYDNKPVGAQFSLAELLHDATVLDNLHSTVNHSFRKRFWVLYDKLHFLNISGNQIASGRFYFRKRYNVVYTGAVGDITDLDEANLCMVCIGSEASNTPQITSFVQVRYTDS